MTTPRKVKNIYWDGPNLVIEYEDGETWKYANATVETINMEDMSVVYKKNVAATSFVDKKTLGKK